MQRRTFLQWTGHCLLATPFLTACGGGSGGSTTAATAPNPPATPGAGASLANPGPLGAADSSGLRLPAGFSARVVARSGADIPGTGHQWHDAPDGGAVFSSAGGGWIYISNSEVADGAGGAGALRFDAAGNLVDSYAILDGTSRNCAGGATPWGTWLSCEEVARGQVWECDPSGRNIALARPALGRFNHEAVAVDPASNTLYLTEDEPDGRLYRFRAAGTGTTGIPDLASGSLEVAQVAADGNGVQWLAVPDPAASMQPTRAQVPDSTAFNGGEGAVWHQGTLFFTTKGDNRVWAHDTAADTLRTIYDAATSATPVLTGVDNITAAADGTLLVAEDGGDMQLVVVDRDGRAVPFLAVVGQDSSELTGPAFTPAMDRLYISSQRGTDGAGITWEVRGPFTG